MPAPCTVLVIDDDPEIRESLQIILEHRGYRVVCAADGEAGVHQALDIRPDLLILDMMMPRASGFFVLERLKHHHAMPVPIIMLTGVESDHQKAYAESLGVDEYLNKPVPPARLLRSRGSCSCAPVAAGFHLTARLAGSYRDGAHVPGALMTPPAAFKAVPTQEDLAAMPRDLSFHPAINPRPKTLTPAQIDQFNRDGYFKPIRIFDDARGDRLAAVLRPAAGESPRGRRQQLFDQHRPR